MTYKNKTKVWSWLAYLVLAFTIYQSAYPALTGGGLDFSVYRVGAMTLIDAEGLTKELYQVTEEHRLPFTYPPFAALLFLPFALLPTWAGIGLVLLLSYGVAWWVCQLIVDYAQQRGYQLPFQAYLGRGGTIALLTALTLTSGPWERGLDLVQINALIMLLVLLDFLRPATRIPRGLLIGIAGGIKLTPLAFGLILLMRKDIKGVITLGASFAATVLLGFLLLPREAQDFWFSALSDPSRVGGIDYVDNISILGWLMHLGIPEGSLLKALQYGLILLLMAGVAYLLPLLHRQGMVLSEISLNAFLMMAMSPISWSHHNTWLPLLLAVIIIDGLGVFFVKGSLSYRLAAALTLIGGLGLYLSPLWIAAQIKGSKDGLEVVPFPGLILASLPIICLYLVVMLWVYQGISRRAEILALAAQGSEARK